MSLYPEFDNLTLDALNAKFRNQPMHGEDPFTYYSELAFLIADKGGEGVRFLQDSADQADTEHLAALLAGLSGVPSDKENPAFTVLVIRLLDDPRAPVISEAITWLARQGTKGESVLLGMLKLIQHTDPYVRARVLDYFSRLFPDTAQVLLRQALKDPHFVVRETAVDNLDELNATDAISNLRPLLNDPHPDVRQATATALEHLAPEIHHPSAISG